MATSVSSRSVVEEGCSFNSSHGKVASTAASTMLETELCWYKSYASEDTCPTPSTEQARSLSPVRHCSEDTLPSRSTSGGGDSKDSSEERTISASVSASASSRTAQPQRGALSPRRSHKDLPLSGDTIKEPQPEEKATPEEKAAPKKDWPVHRDVHKDCKVLSVNGANFRLGEFPGIYIQGVKYPSFFKEKAVFEMQQQFSARAGDVFIVSHFPMWGVQRLLVALVEGRSNPWAESLIDKPYYCDAGASRRGVKQYIDEVSSWTGRRCFKTHAKPNLFPCRYPFEVAGDHGKFAPKIVVLVADPRNDLMMLHNSIKTCLGYEASVTDFLQDFLEDGGQSMIFGNWMEHIAAWSEEAVKHPETVRLFNADRLGSLDPKEFAAELADIAAFVGVAEDSVPRLTEATFRRPSVFQPDPPTSIESRHLMQASQSGHLIEQSARNLYLFEDALSQVGRATMELWKDMLTTAFQYSSDSVVQVAQAASKGVLSLPPVAMTEVFAGEAAHAAGVCRPCVFALRGVCKDTAAMCRYCHDPSHPRTKRATRAKRAARKALQRLRTPSPSGFYD